MVWFHVIQAQLHLPDWLSPSHPFSCRRRRSSSRAPRHRPAGPGVGRAAAGSVAPTLSPLGNTYSVTSCRHSHRRTSSTRRRLTFSCLKKQSIFSSRNTLLQETRFWKTLGIFLRATRFPSLGSVTDLRKERRTRTQ